MIDVPLGNIDVGSLQSDLLGDSQCGHAVGDRVIGVGEGLGPVRGGKNRGAGLVCVVDGVPGVRRLGICRGNVATRPVQGVTCDVPPVIVGDAFLAFIGVPPGCPAPVRERDASEGA